MTLRSGLAALGALAVAGLVAAPAHANLVTNGDFSTGDFTGWTLGGDAANPSASSVGHATTFPGEIGAPTGNAAYLGTLTQDSFIAQLLNTVTGKTYEISFQAQADSGTTAPNFLTASFGGSAVSGLSLVDTGANNWATYDALVVATGSTSALTFNFRNDPSFFELANVDVEVPEPSTWALLVAGLAGLTLMGRRRSGGAV